jgi:hypothetical protein
LGHGLCCRSLKVMGKCSMQPHIQRKMGEET